MIVGPDLGWIEDTAGRKLADRSWWPESKVEAACVGVGTRTSLAGAKGVVDVFDAGDVFRFSDRFRGPEARPEDLAGFLVCQGGVESALVFRHYGLHPLEPEVWRRS